MTTTLSAGMRFAVFSIKKTGARDANTIWTRAGSAFVNRDGSLNVYLDVLPLDGRLHLREAQDKRDEVAPPAAESAAPAAGGTH